ncbi:D-glycero-alpha-D-manno-heptose-1,7-bisphosphate 7-phosphatase [Streptomyces sp. NPDC054842]
MNAIDLVLFDRDGTLVHDVPYNGDPELVRPVDDAREALGLLRGRGIGTGVVTNQSGIARGLLSAADVRRVNERIDDLLGPFDVWAVCPHGPKDGCDCRKPRAGMILWAADRLRTPPERIAVIGDIGADVEAASRAGALGVLVPTAQTRPEEVAAAAHVAPDLRTAVRTLLARRQPLGSAPVGEEAVEAAHGTTGRLG